MSETTRLIHEEKLRLRILELIREQEKLDILKRFGYNS